MAKELFSLPRPRKRDILELPEANRKEIDKYKAAGYLERPSRRGIVRLAKSRENWELFEHEVFIFFKDGLRLGDADGGPACVLGDHQIDACGGLNGVFVIVDAKHTDQPSSSSVRAKVDDLARKIVAVHRDVLSRFGTRYKAVCFVLVTNATATLDEITYAHEHGVFLADGRYYEICRSLYRTIGSIARFQIIKDFLSTVDPRGIPPEWTGQGVRRYWLPALKVSLPNNVSIFSFYMPAEELLRLAYVSRLETRAVGAYQRLLRKDKLDQIAEFLSDGGYFKNNIIVGLAEKPYFKCLDSKTGGSGLYAAMAGRIGLRRVPASLWVVDGQHRLYGFARASQTMRRKSLPAAAIYDGGETAEQARTFVDINKNQTPISPDILWSLYSEIQPNTREGTISLMIKELSQKGVFKDRIYVPDLSARSRSAYKLFMNNLCKGIMDRQFLNPKSNYAIAEARGAATVATAGTRNALATALSHFFGVAMQAARESELRWIDDFIFTNNGANILLRVLAEMIWLFQGRYQKNKAREILLEPLTEFFARRATYIDDLRLGSSSEAGRTGFATEIIARVNKSHPAFGADYLARQRRVVRKSKPYELLSDLEKALRQFIEKVLRSVAGENWQDQLPIDVRTRAEERMKANQSLWPWGRQEGAKLLDFFDFNDYARIIDRKWPLFQKTFRAREMILGKLQELDPVRKDIAHSRTLESRECERLELYTADIKRAIKEASASIGGVTH